MQPYPSFLIKTAALFLACLLIGCSAARLAYSNGEVVVYWWLNSYVDFDSAQQLVVKRSIARFFEWHRKTQLPDYAQLLTQAQQRLQHTVPTGEVSADVDLIEQRVARIFDETAPDFAELARSLQPRQIAQIEKKFQSNNEKYRKEFLSGDSQDRQRARYKQVMKHAEYWFGSFSADQQAKIRAAADARSTDGEASLAIRMQRQDELIAMLKKMQHEKPDSPTATRMVRKYVAAAMEHFGDAKMQAASDASRESGIALAVMIINMATPKQKAFATERLKRWVEDFRGMAGA